MRKYIIYTRKCGNSFSLYKFLQKLACSLTQCFKCDPGRCWFYKKRADEVYTRLLSLGLYLTLCKSIIYRAHSTLITMRFIPPLRNLSRNNNAYSFAVYIGVCVKLLVARVRCAVRQRNDVNRHVGMIRSSTKGDG